MQAWEATEITRKIELQFGRDLQYIRLNGTVIGGLVGLSICKELAPVMMAILIAGRVGSAITAELASMKVYQEVDALVTMNIPPERMLVLPRLAAVLFGIASAASWGAGDFAGGLAAYFEPSFFPTTVSPVPGVMMPGQFGPIMRVPAWLASLSR